jgi:two-component sensor histidine kinase
VLDSVPSQIAILGSDGVIIDVNTPWKRFGEENEGTKPEKFGPGANYFCPWSPAHGDTTNAAPAFEGVRQVQLGELEDFQIDYPCHSPQRERWFTMRVLPLTGAPGQLLVSHTDITPLKETEKNLVATLAEKEVLLREVHHRVKNNLAAIIALLDMQSRFLKHTEGREVLTELANRIRSMSLIHEKLYHSRDLAHIHFQDYLQALLSHLCTSFGSPGIRCLAEAKGVTLPLDLAVPCGMVINELVTNALKYAFPHQLLESSRHACFIRVTMHQQNDVYTLVVADNGVGLPDGYNWMNATTLGMTLVRMLGRHQLGGHLTLTNDQGLQITLTFTEQRGKQ